jgi:hypothetical protein
MQVGPQHHHRHHRQQQQAGLQRTGEGVMGVCEGGRVSGGAGAGGAGVGGAWVGLGRAGGQGRPLTVAQVQQDGLSRCDGNAAAARHNRLERRPRASRVVAGVGGVVHHVQLAVWDVGFLEARRLHRGLEPQPQLAELVAAGRQLHLVRSHLSRAAEMNTAMVRAASNAAAAAGPAAATASAIVTARHASRGRRTKTSGRTGGTTSHWTGRGYSRGLRARAR